MRRVGQVGMPRMRISTSIVLGIVLLLPSAVFAQRGRGAGAGAAPQTPRAASPVDLTGYWVSVVTEDWRYRMVTPAKGDFQGVPITAAARDVAIGWDPARDEAEGAQCKAYGAPAIMRVPGRLHITWQDDNTLKIQTDAGRQVRVLSFSPAPRAVSAVSSVSTVKTVKTWQGTSAAEWENTSLQASGLAILTIPP